MRRNNDYLSEFEREFESDDAFSESTFELGDNEGDTSEWENDDESDDAYEAPEEGEFELEYDDQEYGNWSSNGGERSREREFEDRLYEALSADSDHEFESLMEIDQVLHEMERDYFFGALKKRGLAWLKKKARSGLGAALQSATGLVKKGLSNKLVQMGAQFIPGAGPAISQGMAVAGQLMNSETPTPTRADVRKVVQVGKQAYQNLANDLTKVRDLKDLPDMGKNALQQAVRAYGSQPGRKQRTEIPLGPGSKVVVYQNKVVIWQS